ncbi:ATP-dependent Clp protease proteolytic subunit [Streptomyces lunaelactis]|uniref:ATP-dependent Clp protease proteolytic subunit n=1 Tax=Streptomyces lunaelactis TaxID=1535768 RepID=UPI0015852E3D|nr:ATP-dependent Clp protease proteolytic subunit [Streptomyces lunaelactis]NUJ99945.1 ATP-dependent Clp protease proteolytic subunit [Streptomyces lunaelactis]NUK07680.1 ATP-dependent Clp protease proteolytic subunit [Streptomyces lunaelactis]NUK16227.1 ATP-dependent Clp protease proteolytic subunit [Streptomyces lunaelactis]NUK21918.1 ATP-dependent Clp protease proteolytic subunit [Streptomyces lunaelactis]NUK33011.1 ATP-dependent Clp protease proteolytic subunit [Streptomyces lunaelactis]
MNRPDARYVLPQFTERTSSGTRTLDPYSRLLEERIIFLGTAVDDTSANDVIAQFLHLEYAAPDRDISLYINSPGGSPSAMSAIYDTMQVVTCDIETTCLGQAASTAALLLAAGAPGKRMALPGARIVVQQPAFEEPLRGQPSDLEIHAQELLRLRAQLTDMFVRHTGQTPERVTEDLERDKIFDAEDARAYGLVDHVIKNRKTSLISPGSR